MSKGVKNSSKKVVSVFGAGSCGTAFAQSLARSGHRVLLWCRNPEQVKSINRNGYNPSYVKDYHLSPLIHATNSLQEATEKSNYWLFLIPTQHLRTTLQEVVPFYREDVEIANGAKGAEITSLKLISQIVEEVLPGAHYTVLSGPSHAEEVIRDLPLAIVSASRSAESAEVWQELLNRDTFRVYTNSDVVGVEVGGAVKNVIAIASGLLRSMEMGDNARASMVTRGLSEMARLGVAMGGNELTFSGLAGLGDLMVTAYSRHSRNFCFGEMIGRGMDPEEAMKDLGQVVEGYFTVNAVRKLSKQLSVEMPINNAVYEVLYEDVDLQTALKTLLSRNPKPEYPQLRHTNLT